LDRRFYIGVTLTGTAEILYDAASKESVWQSGDEKYYPLGVTDPDYCVIRFTTLSGKLYRGYKTETFGTE
jgi:general stress protein 26